MFKPFRELLIITGGVLEEVIVPKMVKQWLNGLWDSQPTVPQPKEITGLELYAPEPAFTKCQTG